MAFNNPLKDFKGIAGNLRLGERAGKFKEGIDRLKGQGKQAWANRGTFAQDIWSTRERNEPSGASTGGFNNPLNDLRSLAGSPLGVAMSRIFGKRDKGIDYGGGDEWLPGVETSGGPGSVGFGGGAGLTQEDIDYDALVGRNQEEDPSLTGSGYLGGGDYNQLILDALGGDSSYDEDDPYNVGAATDDTGERYPVSEGDVYPVSQDPIDPDLDFDYDVWD